MYPYGIMDMKGMVKIMVKYIGVNDRKIDLFEGQFVVPE